MLSEREGLKEGLRVEERPACPHLATTQAKNYMDQYFDRMEHMASDEVTYISLTLTRTLTLTLTLAS